MNERSIQKLQEAIAGILQNLDKELAQDFLEIFQEKLGELREQTTNLQKDPGASR
jgi:hypothetical protein